MSTVTAPPVDQAITLIDIDTCTEYLAETLAGAGTGAPDLSAAASAARRAWLVARADVGYDLLHMDTYQNLIWDGRVADLYHRLSYAKDHSLPVLIAMAGEPTDSDFFAAADSAPDVPYVFGAYVLLEGTVVFLDELNGFVLRTGSGTEITLTFEFYLDAVLIGIDGRWHTTVPND